MDTEKFMLSFTKDDGYTSLLKEGKYAHVIDETDTKEESLPLVFPYSLTYRIVSGADILGGVITPTAVEDYFEKNNLRTPRKEEALLAFARIERFKNCINPVIAVCCDGTNVIVHTCVDYYGRVSGPYIHGKRYLKINNNKDGYRSYCEFLAVEK